MEYASGGEFEEYLVSKPDCRLSEGEAKFLIAQIWRAISYCHQKGIIHRDLKPENILVTYASQNRDEEILFDHPPELKHDYEDIILKVSDFGIAGIKKTGSKGEESNAGTVQFMAPELHTGSDISADKTLDIWALGIILYVMVFGYHPFKEKSTAESIKSIIEKKVKFSPDVPVSPEFKDLIRKMLDKDPKKRINMFKILNHVWFEDKDEDTDEKSTNRGKFYFYSTSSEHINVSLNCE